MWTCSIFTQKTLFPCLNLTYNHNQPCSPTSQYSPAANGIAFLRSNSRCRDESSSAEAAETSILDKWEYSRYCWQSQRLSSVWLEDIWRYFWRRVMRLLEGIKYHWWIFQLLIYSRNDAKKSHRPKATASSTHSIKSDGILLACCPSYMSESEFEFVNNNGSSSGIILISFALTRTPTSANKWWNRLGTRLGLKPLLLLVYTCSNTKH